MNVWPVNQEGPPGPPGAPGATGAPGSAGAGYLATSPSSVLVAGSGSKTFGTQFGLAYSPGCRVRVTSTGSGAVMEGICTAYTGVLLAGLGGVIPRDSIDLVITVDFSSGSGTHSDWSISPVGEPGA